MDGPVHLEEELPEFQRVLYDEAADEVVAEGPPHRSRGAASMPRMIHPDLDR